MSKDSKAERLADVNNGRPFAWLPAGTFARGECNVNGTARYVLLALYTTARYQDSPTGQEASYLYTPRVGWGPWLGLSERTARNCFRALCEIGRLDRIDDDGRCGLWELTESALFLREEQGLNLRVELAPMTRPSWTCGMRAAWIGLCGFTNHDRARLECWPGQSVLAERAGMTRRNLQRALYRMADAGNLEIVRRRGSSKFVLYPLGGAPARRMNRRKIPATIAASTPARIAAIDRQESPQLPATIAAIDRQESPHRTRDFDLEPLNERSGTRDQEPRSRRSGANASTVYDAEFERKRRKTLDALDALRRKAGAY